MNKNNAFDQGCRVAGEQMQEIKRSRCAERGRKGGRGEVVDGQQERKSRATTV
jgi:hypothetical protein